MKSFARREALAALISGSVGLLLAENTETFAQQPATLPKAFAGQHQIKPLPFDPAKLKGISEKLIRSHWENNYSGALRALNAVEQRLAAMAADKDLPAYVYGDVKREEALRTGSVVLHEIYFSHLGGDGKAGGDVLNALKQTFGSYETWEAEFKRTGAALGGGSGWVMLGVNLHTGELHNYWSWDHLHNAPTSLPLLVMDMYEHAYQMDYGAAAAKYIDAFLANLSWEAINHRYVKAQKALLAWQA